MKITAIQKYSIHDGDGIRTTIFFKGCPLHCLWCHNPETQRFEAELLDHPEKCIGCRACLPACPQGAITLTGRTTASTQTTEATQMPGTPEHVYARTDRTLCTACGACTMVCPENIREIAGEERTEAELLREIRKDQMFYEDSGGGVTFSGGEVLAGDIDTIVSLARAVKQEGISLYLDTCGAVPWSRIEAILPYTDVFLYDLKCVDSEKHRMYTGMDNAVILENLKALSGKKAIVDLRIPLVRGVNGTDGEVASMAAFLEENKIRPRRIHLLPYHNTGAAKYARVGREYLGNAFAPPTEDELRRYEEIFRAAGYSDVRRGG